MTAHVSPSREPELLALRKLAEDLAQRRSERPTTGHLLAAVASRPSAAADLLRERRLDVDVLLKAARVVTDDGVDALGRAVQRAREFAQRSAAREPTSIHLLFALCQDRGNAAHRAIEQCGTDVAKLRTAAMQLAMGIATPRRIPVHAAPSPAMKSALPLSTQRPPPSRPSHPTHPAPMTKQQYVIGGPSASSSSPAGSTGPTGSVGARTPSPLVPSKPSTPSQSVQSVLKLIPSSAEHTITSKQAAPSHAHGGTRARKAKHTASTADATTVRGAETERFALDPKRFPTLVALGKNLTLAAERGELDPVIGRDEEIERTLDVLAKRQANNPCLVGPAGVGKTSVARGIALRIAAGKDVVSLDDRIVIEIEPSALLAGTAARGSLAERIVQIKTELRAAPGRIVLFFDEIHTLFSGDGGDEGVTELKMALAKGEIVCIGATTGEEYKRTIDADPALARRFSLVEVEEPSPEEAFLALEAIAPLLSGHHHTKYTEQALLASVTWSVRYIPGRALPDKAIGILDLAGARARRRSVDEVSAEHIAEVVSELAGVPMERLLESDGERMLRLESLLAERIVGHGAALGRIAAVLRRNASGFRSRRPIGSFLLLGPTGVGKTETAKAIAECLFYSPDAMTRLDLSEYSEPHAIARLVGAPPGYVGHEAGGQLTEAVRRRPYQVILLDEIEKAHRDVLEGFLQVFDEGRMTDGRGRTIDFTNTVILLTSNLGASELRDKANTKGKIGFGGGRASSSEDAADHENILISAARAALPPELYNRLDEVLAFAPLRRVDVAEVARRMLAGLALDLEGARGVKLDVSEAAIDALLDEGGFDPEMGARPMRRAIARLVEAPVAEMILRGEVRRGDVATVDVEQGKIVVDAVTP